MPSRDKSQAAPSPPRALTSRQALLEAEAALAAGRLQEAAALCQGVLKAVPNSHEAYHLLGLAAYQAGQAGEAIGLVGQAIALDGAQAAYHRNLGEMLRRAGRLDDAVAACRRATVLDSNDAGAWYNLGVALAARGEREEAIVCYRRATAIDPKHNLAFNNLGALLEAQGDTDAAKKAYAAAVAIDPRHAEAQNNLGAILSAEGDLDDARACFNAAIAARAAFVDPHFNLSTLKRYSSGDPQLPMLETLFYQRHKLPPADRARLAFAVGKARADLGAHERAFKAYAEGNRLKRESFHYDEQQNERSVEAVLRTFTPKFLAAHRPKGPPTADTAVFIVGMPRSGTTLIEQILASHPQVHGGGELGDLDEIVRALHQGGGRPFPEALADLAPEDLQAMGADYHGRLKAHAPEAQRITDKMPANFFYLGLIHLILPGARIIHSRRNAMDTCLSNFTRLFNQTMEFAYDLGELGRYYRRYRRLMEHWAAVLPKGAILEVDYEAVVEDLEGQARRMIADLGLPWDEACLAFHHNPRPVQTASIAQVRQPIYRSSMERWRAYEKELGPLISALGDAAGAKSDKDTPS
jgi:tetratricopeptide (TPR) repeat protein